VFGYAAMVAVGTESHDVYTEWTRFSVTVLDEELGIRDVVSMLTDEFAGWCSFEPGMSWCSIESIEVIEMNSHQEELEDLWTERDRPDPAHELV